MEQTERVLLPEDACIDLSILLNGWPNLSQRRCAEMAETASVCLKRAGHALKVQLSVLGDKTLVLWLCGFEVKETEMHTYDGEEAQEDGATAIAILLIAKQTPYVVAKRALKKTGFDWYLSRQEDLLFQNAARLEVSGTIIKNQFKPRIKQKFKQVSISDDTGLPAYVVVVDFSQPTPRCHLEHYVPGAKPKH